jgi:hypothetical protein
MPADRRMTQAETGLDAFIDLPDPALLELQKLAAVQACSDRRYLPERYRDADRATLIEQFTQYKLRAGRR